MTPENKTEKLFSYGTLQQEDVQLATFGRTLAGKPDVLIGYRLMMTQVRDPNFGAANGVMQRNVEFTGNAEDFIRGIVFAVTNAELEQSDAYEPTDYQRIRVELRSGESAWVYSQIRK